MTAPNSDPMTRIADALELMALAHTYDVSECPAMAQIRRRIEARHSAPTVSVPVLPTTDAGNAFVDGLLRDARETRQQTPVRPSQDGPIPACVSVPDEGGPRVAPSGGDSGHLSPPPDDDPEWRDVPAEWAALGSLRCGDRYYSHDDRAWSMIEADIETPWPDIRWIKRHDHPARKPAPLTVDVKGSR